MTNFQELSEEFDNLCQRRHEMGQEKYGAISFIDRDTVNDILEELADAANYLRYLYIKMRLAESAYHLMNESSQKIGVEGFNSMSKDDS